MIGVQRSAKISLARATGQYWLRRWVAQLDDRVEAVDREAKANVASMWPEGPSEVVPLDRSEGESGV